MALNKAQLTTQLIAIFSDLNPAKTPIQVATQIADAIDDYVKSGSVVSNGVTTPTVPGSPAKINGLEGTIS